MDKHSAICAQLGQKPIQVGDAFYFLAETAADVKRLPYYSLCAISDQTHLADPTLCIEHWMAGPFCVRG